MKKLIQAQSLLEIYKTKLIAPQKTVIEVFIEAIRECVGIIVGIEQVTYTPSTKTIKLNIHSIKKTEVLFKKNEILTYCEKKLGKKNKPEVIL